MPSAFSNRRLQAEENSVNKAHGITIQILKALVNKKKWKTIKSGLARQREVWIVGSKFEKMCIQKFNAHRISRSIIFADCLLKVLSII